MITKTHFGIISAIALISFLVGFFLGRRSRKKIKIDAADIRNVASGINQKEKLTVLYKSLMKKIHPDRNPSKAELSKKYSMLVNEHRRNFDMMMTLEKEIDEVFN